MKIAIATTTGFHLVHLARELIARGNDVTYYSSHPLYRIVRDGVPRRHARAQFAALQPFATGALQRVLPALQGRCVETMLERMDEQVARRLEPCDVFIGLSAMMDKSGEAARRMYGARVVADRGAMHVLTQRALTAHNGVSTLSERYVRRELRSYEVADYVALPSRNCVRSFVEHGVPERKLFLNLYGVDLARFMPTPRPAGDFTAIFVGNWSRTKAVDIICAAARRLPDVTFLHAGTAGDCHMPQMKNLRSLGHVPNGMLRETYAKAHALLLPSRQDGFGMVMLEALASGLSVIASEKTGAPDIRQRISNKHAVEIVEAESVESLVGAITRTRQRVCAQPAHEPRHLMSDADIAYFGWQAYARRYAAFIAAIGGAGEGA
ncbi:glycosyltransferase family 4 protein [Cupriavidus sp. WS]|uniref:glycosyltransferase family 4 protein n=1 Tax=Cupriavidus sp. WS TaxID=1312922 RepID=UPI000381C572|nr:glycosyltransferase family 4 protein [Cupriavidus sp. WS]